MKIIYQTDASIGVKKMKIMTRQNPIIPVTDVLKRDFQTF